MIGYVPSQSLQQTLHTERMTLVPLAEEHLEHEVELDADPEVMRYLVDGRARTREEVVVAHRRRLATARVVDGLGFWAGFLREDGQFVGWWILEPPSREAGSDVGAAGQSAMAGQAELGYRIMRRLWRHGLASEGSRELLRHGFEDLGLERVFAQTMAVNAGSQAVMASLGMRLVRTFALEDSPDFSVAIEGSQHGEVEYAVTRREWTARPS